MPPRPALSNPVQVSAGMYHTCALDSTGVHCWGRDVDGESSPSPLVAPTQVVAGHIAAMSCALAAGEVVCWGSSAGAVRQVPTLISPSAIGARPCALDTTGVVCW